MAPTLRERKKVDTRRRIETVALDRFLAHGYAATTVDDIADAAGISVRTFYRYFRSKDALVFARFDPALQGMLAALRARDRSLPTFESLRRAIHQAADVMEEIRHVLKYVWILAAEDPELESHSMREIMRWRAAFTAEIAEQAGLPVYDSRVQMIAIALHGTLSAGTAQWRGTGGNGPLATEVRKALDLLVDLDAAAAFLPIRDG